MRKNMNKYAEVIVTYNRKKLLKENIEALLNQTFKDHDILIVDNNSNDGTKEMVAEIQDKRIKYYNTGKNLGGAGGFAFGLRKAISMFINMVLTFSILITKRFGITSRSLQSLIVSPTHRWLIIKENYSPFRSTCTPLTRCGEL